MYNFLTTRSQYTPLQVRLSTTLAEWVLRQQISDQQADKAMMAAMHATCYDTWYNTYKPINA